MERGEGAMHVAMFPWLAMGHLLPFFRMSKLLAQKGHKVSFISTPRNIERLPNLPSSLSSFITFVSFPLQPSLKSAFDLLQKPLTEFLQEESPDWVIYDYAAHWLPPVAAELGISKAFFSIFNAASLCFLGPPSLLLEGVRSTPEDFTVVPPWIPFQSNMAYHTNGVSDSARFGYSISESDAVFVHTSTGFEPEWLGLLKDLYRKPVFPTGFLPTDTEDEVEGDKTWVGIKKWLDKQSINSVVYVALGTEASLPPAEFTELAHGLEKSEVPFFWVIRNESQILDGYVERVAGRGMVNVGWVPQVKILSHSSVGGFLTHCGWNSLVEGLGFGRVPILFPVLNEQGLNTRLLEGKGLGVEIPRDEEKGSFDSDSVAHSVRLAMVDDAGESIRAKTKLMMGLFGNMDENSRYVDELIGYMRSK
ncbi:BnaCnng53280D [Brassica napus]|uniref:BnaCnng53280D protein n=1 Tax=Brassica napus TaxID=3708 RepID=A0A078JJT6_BRANA|nr:BnaCnng53280D [Brassica napus]